MKTILQHNIGFATTDPEICTKLERTEAELQEFLIFCICVAGKTARVVQKSLQKFWPQLLEKVEGNTPFQIVNRWLCLHVSQRQAHKKLAEKLQECGIGCHNLKARGIMAIARAYSKGQLNLREVSPEELEAFPGIGPKTSRYFILHSRKDARVACLDVHVLRWMRMTRRLRNVPLQTPQSRAKYKALEKRFLRLVPKDKTIAEFDLELWLAYSRKTSTE